MTMMFLYLVLCTVAVLPGCVPAASPLQKPLIDDAQVPGQLQGEKKQSQWTLNFTSPIPHLFASIPSLLHQWSNTIFPNGHTLAPVEIPAYTLFYHGLISPDESAPAPPSPEWLAFDLEMAYGIMGSSRNSFLLTYQTTKPVKALYFDGESAALMGLGQMDTQMLQLFGNVSGPPGQDFFSLGQEYLRAHGLCQWFEVAGLGGRGWGFEGVVRMNAGFEMIWCDFSSPSLRLVSRLNVTVPLLAAEDEGNVTDDEVDDHSQAPILSSIEQESTSYYPLPPQPTKTGRDSEPSHPAAPPNWRHDLGREPFLAVQGWGWFDSATWHYGSTRSGPGRGEVKAKVLSCGVLSYYSPQFSNQSLNRAFDERKILNLTAEGLWEGPGEYGNRTKAIKQLARRRRFHHLGDVIPEEASLMRENSERALRSLLTDNSCSGADWAQITSEIVQRTTNHLTMVDTKLLSIPHDHQNDTAVSRWLYDLRAQIHLFMVGYLEYPTNIEPGTWSTLSGLYQETYSRCKYRYTRLLVPEDLRISLPREEEDIRVAVEVVHGTICSVLLTLGFGIEHAWFENADSAKIVVDNLASRAAQWHAHIEELQAWLGWESEYYGCRETCAWDERCYIPMWPLVHSIGGGPGGGPGRHHSNGTRPGRPSGGRGPPAGGPGYGPGRGYPPECDDNDGDSCLPPPPRPSPPNQPGTGPGRPDFRMPPRGPWWMGDDTDLWEPKCVNIEYIMGQR